MFVTLQKGFVTQQKGFVTLQNEFVTQQNGNKIYQAEFIILKSNSLTNLLNTVNQMRQ